MNKVTVTEAIQIRVANWLTEKGYPVNSATIPSTPDFCSMPLQLTVRKQSRFLCFYWGNDQDYHIGRLCLRDKRIGVHGKNWLMEVYGREHTERLTNLASELAEKFKVDVHARLEQERPNLINYGTDW